MDDDEFSPEFEQEIRDIIESLPGGTIWDLDFDDDEILDSQSDT